MCMSLEAYFAESHITERDSHPCTLVALNLSCEEILHSRSCAVAPSIASAGICLTEGGAGLSTSRNTRTTELWNPFRSASQHVGLFHLRLVIAPVLTTTISTRSDQSLHHVHQCPNGSFPKRGDPNIDPEIL